MFHLYSKGCEYAIKALIQLKDENQNYDARNICRRARVPESFARKIFQDLVRNNFLEAVSGPGGGYRLKKKPDEITILDIVHAVDGEDSFDQCIMGLSKCGNQKPCLLHESWLKAKIPLLTELKKKKLSDLIKDYDKKNR